MGGAVGPQLAAAVSNAGDSACWCFGGGPRHGSAANPADARADVQAVRGESQLRISPGRRLAACLDEGVRIISFFWRDPATLMPRAKAASVTVLHTAASPQPPGAPWTAVSISSSPRLGGRRPCPRHRGDHAAHSRRGRRRRPGSGRCRGWHCRRAGPRRGSDARCSRRLDRHAFSRQHGSSDPCALSRTAVASQREPMRSFSKSCSTSAGRGAAPRLRNKTVASWEAAGRPPSGKRPGEGE